LFEEIGAYMCPIRTRIIINVSIFYVETSPLYMFFSFTAA